MVLGHIGVLKKSLGWSHGRSRLVTRQITFCLNGLIGEEWRFLSVLQSFNGNISYPQWSTGLTVHYLGHA